MKVKWIVGLVVLLLGMAGGAIAGLWWSTTSEHEICARLEEECGESAMPMRDCLEGRQADLVHYGVGGMRRVHACLAKAPHDCLSVSACLGAVEE